LGCGGHRSLVRAGGNTSLSRLVVGTDAGAAVSAIPGLSRPRPKKIWRLIAALLRHLAGTDLKMKQTRPRRKVLAGDSCRGATVVLGMRRLWTTFHSGA